LQKKDSGFSCSGFYSHAFHKIKGRQVHSSWFTVGFKTFFTTDGRDNHRLFHRKDTKGAKVFIFFAFPRCGEKQKSTSPAGLVQHFIGRLVVIINGYTLANLHKTSTT
jgi:hypothetical protein